MDFLAIEINRGLLIGIVVCVVAFIVFIIYAIIKDRKIKPGAGAEEMVGKEAVVEITLNPRGTVLAEGELWTAIAAKDKIESGEEVIITKVAGLKLWVTKKSEEKEG